MDIVFSDITLRYGQHTVYDKFDFTARDREITAVLGRSGCGKTTLLNLAAGLLRPQAGTVEFDSLSATAAVCSYVFQTPRLLPNLTAEGNLLYAGATPERAGELLEKIEVPAAMYPKAMSGGMAQRVGLARAFIRPEPIVLLDEPFKSLDLGLKHRLMTLTRALIEENAATVLFVTHDPAEADFLADRAVVIEQGKILYDQQKTDGRFVGLKEVLEGL